MKDYLGDLLVWGIILVILIPIFVAFARRKRLFIIIVGLLIFVGAFPAAFMSEVSINGCCGAPSSGFEGAGYLIGGLLAIAGILIVIFSNKLAKH